MSSVVGELPVGLLPDEVLRAIVGLRIALRAHCDYDEFQVALDLKDETILPRVHFIINGLEVAQ